MNLGEIQTRVKRLFGDESGVQISDEDIARWANDAQMDIVRKTEYLQGHKQTGGVAGDGSYTLPSDVLQIRRVTFDDRLLKKATMEQLDQQYGSRDGSYGSSGGYPYCYYTWGNILYIYPAPASGGTGNLDIWYVRSPATLAGTGDTPELPIQMHEDIVRYCLKRAKELDEDFEAADRIGTDYEGRLAQAKFEAYHQGENSYPAVRLLAGDDW